MFSVKSKFTSHMSRKHKRLENVICGLNKDTQSESPSTSATIQEGASVSDTEDPGMDGSNFSDPYLRNVCMFYIKLQGQHLLPASTRGQSSGCLQEVIEMILTRRKSFCSTALR